MSALHQHDEEWVEALEYPWPSGPYIPHEPTIPQDAFLWYQGQEALYGGAAGGGKSDALLMAALQYVDNPGYASLLMRRTYTELMLENALLDRAHKWLTATQAHWNGDTMRWTFPSGARIAFGYLDRPRDRERYQSAEYQMIGMDELTAWEETDYRFMFSRLRKLTGVDFPLRMRAATNPGNRGHKWVKERFLLPFMRGEHNPKRIFIPAKLSDNPHIDQESYRSSLHELEPELAEQLLEGNWDAREPGDWMLRDPRWVDAAAQLGKQLWADHVTGKRRLPEPWGDGLINCIDWGEHTQGYVLWRLPGGGIFIPPSEVVMIGRDPAETTRKLLEVAMAFEYPIVQSNYDAAGVQSMRTYLNIARRFPRYKFLKSTKIPFKKYKTETIGYLRVLARRSWEIMNGSRAGPGAYDEAWLRMDESGLVADAWRFLAIHPDNEELIRQLRTWKRKGPESDEAVKEDDHGPDALVAGAAPTAREHRQHVEKEMLESYNDDEYTYEEGGLAYER